MSSEASNIRTNKNKDKNQQQRKNRNTKNKRNRKKQHNGISDEVGEMLNVKC